MKKKMKQGLAADFFLFFKKALYRIKALVCNLVLISFGRPPPEYTIKTNFSKCFRLFNKRDYWAKCVL